MAVTSMSLGVRITLLGLGVLGIVYCLAWALDYKGFSSSVLSRLYRNWGRWLWPWGSERAYVVINRNIGWPGAVICAVMVVTALTGANGTT